MTLYRYNLIEPPSSWTEEFKNLQYVSLRGAKNSIGAYFFYSKYETAVNVGRKAIQETRGNNKMLYITSAQLQQDANLLDLSLPIETFEPEYMLDLLYDNGIDVLTDKFLHINPSHKLSEIREDYFKIREAKQSEKQLPWNHDSRINVNGFFMGNSSHLGQCLTDFENGFMFKQLLEEKGYDGYVFVEEVNDPTVCIFDSSFLSQPTTQVIQL